MRWPPTGQLTFRGRALQPRRPSPPSPRLSRAQGPRLPASLLRRLPRLKGPSPAAGRALLPRWPCSRA
eukprot:12823990-Alexandrium_andersonii.AAC.1